MEYSRNNPPEPVKAKSGSDENKEASASREYMSTVR